MWNWLKMIAVTAVEVFIIGAASEAGEITAKAILNPKKRRRRHKIQTITLQEVKDELNRHGSSWEDFKCDFGEKTDYCRARVLKWLNCKGC